MSTAIVCRPSTYLRRRVTYCPTCDLRRRFVVRDAAWYGSTSTCCGCGDAWSEEGRMERPFKRGWRADAVAGARADWDAAGAYDHAAWVRWLVEQVGEPQPRPEARPVVEVPLPDPAP